MSSPEPPAPEQREVAAQRRIHRVLVVNIGIVVCVVTGVLGVWVFAVASRWILVIVALTVVYGSTLVLALRRNQRGELDWAVLVMNLAVWPLAVGATVIAPDALPITSLASLGPVLLAVPELPRRTVARVLGVAVLLTLAVVVIGTTTDVTGLTDRIDPPILDAAIIMSVPALIALVLLIGAQNQALLTDRTEALAHSRAALTEAADRERRRIERDLHDGAQQRLHGALVQLSVAGRLLDAEPERAVSFVTGARQELLEAVTELHDLVYGVDPAGLREMGLVAALRSAAVRRNRPAELRVVGLVDPTGPGSCGDPGGPESPAAEALPSEVEATVWFCCMEALANIDKHVGSGAAVRLELIRQGAVLRMTVSDDGPGFVVPPVPGSGGLRNMADRVAAVGGTLQVSSSVLGTRLLAVIPLPPTGDRP